MRIRELFERKIFKDDNFVNVSDKGREINFDVVEDLIHYMNHEDNLYRRHVFPSVAKCVDMHKKQKTPNPRIFKSAVEECYKSYVREYPIRELPESIDEKTCYAACDKLCQEVIKDIKAGKYRD